MEHITVTGPTASALLQELDYQSKHKGEPRLPCHVKGCPWPAAITYAGVPISMCTWHDEVWGTFLENHRKATGKCVRLGKFGNWHIRFREFMAWAEKESEGQDVSARSTDAQGGGALSTMDCPLT